VTFDVLYPKVEVDDFLTDESNELSEEEETLLNQKILSRDELIEAVYIQSCYLSFGAGIIVESRHEFDEFMKKVSGLMLIEETADRPATSRYIPTVYSQLYDYLLDVKKNMWVPWKSLLPAYVHNRDKSFGDILVPTIDTVRASWYVDLMSQRKRPLVLVGETGTSKSALIMNYLKNLNTDKFVRFDIIFQYFKFYNINL
jgi:dynein heavy chain